MFLSKSMKPFQSNVGEFSRLLTQSRNVITLPQRS